MECERIRKLLSAYLDNELSEEERKEVRRHLFVCSQCELEFKKIRSMKGLISQFGRFFEPRVDYEIHYEVLQSQAKGRRMKEVLLFSVLACIVILFFVFFLPIYKDIMLGSNADMAIGEIHRNLSGDSYDVPKNPGRVEVNFLKQVSNDWE
ncbi:MAG: hypothetical protein GX432_03080 [Candidatus Atribacteria bacterium]|nr:hypothetical protein [Candidatus Atribacteria bacterium]